MKPTLVVGGGLLGLATAHELMLRGREVTVLERHEGVALEASHANGGILTPSMSDPWNSPGVHRQLLASLFDSRAALKLRLSALPSLAFWGLQFLWNSRPHRHRQSTLAAFHLANYSVRATRALRERMSLEYDAGTIGTMKLFREEKAYDIALQQAELLKQHGLRFSQLDRAGIVREEPQLSEIASRLVGALRFPDDESGDAYRFCLALASRLEANGGRIDRGVTVRRIVQRKGRVVGIESDNGIIEADEVVIACGVHSRTLIAPLGIDIPVRPAKGYSLTLDVSGLKETPRMPLVDDALHVAIVPIGDRLRIAGTAEFAGMDCRIRPERVDNLLDALKSTYPRIAASAESCSPLSWAGLRPMSSDGLPVVGESSVRGLYVSAGHGPLGWTMAAGSACLVADMMTGVSPAIDPTPYRLGR